MSWQAVAVTSLLLSSILFSNFIKRFPRDLIFTITGLLTAVAGIISSGKIYQSLTSQAILTAVGFWLFGRALGAPSTFFSHRLLVNCILLASLFVSKISIAIVLFLFSLFLLHEGQFKFEGRKLRQTILVLLIYLAAAIMTIAGLPIGTTFFFTGMAILLIRPSPVKEVFRKEFPLPGLLDLFSAYLFFFAINSSGLNRIAADLIPANWPFIPTLTLFVLAAQGISFLMPCTVAFSILFSIALSFFSGHPDQIVISGTVLAFFTTLPFFLNRNLSLNRLGDI